MATIHSTVKIDGAIARLTDISEAFAVIVGSDRSRKPGDPCDFTVYAELMGRCVPVNIHGEIVQQNDDQIEVMFAPPTKNWSQVMCTFSMQNV